MTPCHIKPVMKKRKFIQKSVYPGGKEAVQQFIKQHLHYPQQAIDANIEGDVLLKYKVTSYGKTTDISIIKGIGYGCDKEAIRLVSKLKYPKKINRQIKVTTHKKITIKFRLPNNKVTIHYSIIE